MVREIKQKLTANEVMACATLVPAIVGPGDTNACPSSAVSNFTVELADALLLQGKWQCRCDSVSFPNVNHSRSRWERPRPLRAGRSTTAGIDQRPSF